MPETAKTVFIDEMPDYQKALQDINALSKYPVAFKAAVDELHLTKQWQENTAAMDALRPQAQMLMSQQAKAIESHSKAASRNASTGNIVAGGSGVAAGVIAYRRWGVVKSILTAFSASLVAKVVYSQLNPQASMAGDKAIEAVKEQKFQLATHALEIQKPFIETMATRMLSEQKALAGVGNDMKLVSTKEPHQQPATHADRVNNATQNTGPARG